MTRTSLPCVALVAIALSFGTGRARASPITSLHDVRWNERVIGEDKTHVLLGTSYVALGEREIAVVHIDIPGDKSERYDVYGLRDGQLVQLGKVGPSSRMGDFVESIAVRGHELIIERLSHAAKDAECCPSLARDEHWVLQGDHLVEDVPRRTVGKAPAATSTSVLRHDAQQLAGLWRGDVLVPTIRLPSQPVPWTYNCRNRRSGGAVVPRDPPDLRHKLEHVQVGAVTSCDDSTGCCKLPAPAHSSTYVELMCFSPGTFELERVTAIDDDGCHG